MNDVLQVFFKIESAFNPLYIARIKCLQGLNILFSQW